MLFIFWLTLAAQAVAGCEDVCETKRTPSRDGAIRRSVDHLLNTIGEYNNSTADSELFRETFSTPSYLRTSTWLTDASRIMDKIIWYQFCERILVRWAINLCLGVNCPSILCKDAVSTATSGTLYFKSVVGAPTKSCGFVVSTPGKRISFSCTKMGTSAIAYNGLSQSGYNQVGDLKVFVPVVVPDSLRVVVNDVNLASPLNCSWTAFTPPTLDG